jgi:hypothetical protein
LSISATKGDISRRRRASARRYWQPADGRASNDLPEPAKLLYFDYQQQRSRPDLDELYDALQSVAATYSRVFQVVDALSECAEIELRPVVFELRRLLSHKHVRVMVTSRPSPVLEREFRDAERLDIPAADGDIQRYIRQHLSQLPDCIVNDATLQKEALSRITIAASGMCVSL